METWDAYDKDFNKVHNATLIRGEAIPEGLFHLVCDIIVKHTDESYLLMQRDRCKQFGACGKPQQEVQHCRTSLL